EIGAIRPDGRAEGRVVRPIFRAHPTVVGIFHYGNRRNYVTPVDQKVAPEIVIPHGMEHPEARADHNEDSSRGKPKARKSVHRVLGKEAARRDGWDDLENVVVDVEITDWPTATQTPRGRVIEIIGYEDDFGVDVEIVIRKFHLPNRFPPEVLEEAERAEPIISSRELHGRRDFRSFPIVTIDGETARDFDDAVTVRKRYAPLVATFELMRELATILNRKRERRGSIDFDLSEPVIQFDEFGLMKSIARSERNIAHRLIEEFMLAANECVAQYLENKR